MSSTLMFVAVALILMAGIVAITFPNTVQAGKLRVDKWCQNFFPGDCFPNKGDCLKTVPDDSITKCRKA